MNQPFYNSCPICGKQYQHLSPQDDYSGIKKNGKDVFLCPDCRGKNYSAIPSETTKPPKPTFITKLARKIINNVDENCHGGDRETRHCGPIDKQQQPDCHPAHTYGGHCAPTDRISITGHCGGSTRSGGHC